MFILLADFWSLLLVVPGRVFSRMSFTGAEAQTRCLCFSQLVRTWSVGVYNFRVCSIVPGMMIPVECINTMAMVWVAPENDENNGLLLPSSLAGIDDKPLDLPIGTHFWLKPSGTVPSAGWSNLPGIIWRENWPGGKSCVLHREVDFASFWSFLL